LSSYRTEVFYFVALKKTQEKVLNKQMRNRQLQRDWSSSQAAA